MPAFHGLAHYEPALVLLLGLSTFAGVAGVGSIALQVLRLRIPQPWAAVAAVLLGTALLSLSVEALAIFQLATPSALLAAWGGFAVSGLIAISWHAQRMRGWRLDWLHERGERYVPVLAGIFILAASIDLLLAMAPATKIDEIYYQLLPAARVALEGELAFYLEPWPAAILPQMGFSYAAAPLHSMGYADAPNVLSWCLAALLSWFVARLVYGETSSGFMALLGAASVQVGLYSSVYQTTGGPHALGDLATAGAVLALGFRDKLMRSCSPVEYIVMVSICSMVAASTKVSLLPIAGLVLVLALGQTLREMPGGRLRLVGVASLPWVVLYLPLCVWSFLQSGSPFGPMLAGAFGPSVFDEAIQAEIAGSKNVNQVGLLWSLRDYVLHYPVIYPLSLLALFIPGGSRTPRVVVGALFLLQLPIIGVLLPHQSRFFSGLHHATLVVGLIQVHPHAKRCLAQGRLVPVAVATALLLPWLGLQAYRAVSLAPIALGIGDREEYFRRFIALYDDFKELDRRLPADAVLFARNRLPSIYFPRPVYMHHRDLPHDRPAFALLGTSGQSVKAEDCAYLRLPDDCRMGDAIYTNPEARYIVFRTPGNDPQIGRIEVRPILSSPDSHRGASPFAGSPAERPGEASGSPLEAGQDPRRSHSPADAR